MNLKEILERSPHFTVRDLQELQGTYDKMFVATKGFVDFDKVRHTYAHLGKLIGRVASYVHNVEEGRTVSEERRDMKNKIIPDLLVYAVWLAEEFGVDLEEAYLKRFLENLKRLHADRVSAEELEELEKAVDQKLGK